MPRNLFFYYQRLLHSLQYRSIRFSSSVVCKCENPENVSDQSCSTATFDAQQFLCRSEVALCQNTDEFPDSADTTSTNYCSKVQRSFGPSVAEVSRHLGAAKLEQIENAVLSITPEGIATIAHYNGLLLLYVQTTYPFSPAEFIGRLKQHGHQPDTLTYQRLLERYCTLGDFHSAICMVTLMQELGMLVSDRAMKLLWQATMNTHDLSNAELVYELLARQSNGHCYYFSVEFCLHCAQLGDAVRFTRALTDAKSALNYNSATFQSDCFRLISILAKNNQLQLIMKVVECYPNLLVNVHAFEQLVLQLVKIGQHNASFLLLRHLFSSNNLSDIKIIHEFFATCLKLNISDEEMQSYCRTLVKEANLPNVFLDLTLRSLTDSRIDEAVRCLRLAFGAGHRPKPEYFWPLIAYHGRLDHVQDVIDMLNWMQACCICIDSDTLQMLELLCKPLLLESLRDTEVFRALAKQAIVEASTSPHDKHESFAAEPPSVGSISPLPSPKPPAEVAPQLKQAPPTSTTAVPVVTTVQQLELKELLKQLNQGLAQVERVLDSFKTVLSSVLQQPVSSSSVVSPAAKNTQLSSIKFVISDHNSVVNEKTTPPSSVNPFAALQEATKLLSRNKMQECFAILNGCRKSFPPSDNDLSVVLAVHGLLRAADIVAGSSCVENILEKGLLRNNIVCATSDLLGFVVVTYLNRNGMLGACSCFTRLASKYKTCPNLGPILRSIITTGNEAMLSQVVATASQYLQRDNIQFMLAFAYVECDRVRDAARIFQSYTGEIPLLRKRVKMFCHKCVKKGDETLLRSLLSAAQGTAHHDKIFAIIQKERTRKCNQPYNTDLEDDISEMYSEVDDNMHIKPEHSLDNGVHFLHEGTSNATQVYPHAVPIQPIAQSSNPGSVVCKELNALSVLDRASAHLQNKDVEGALNYLRSTRLPLPTKGVRESAEVVNKTNKFLDLCKEVGGPQLMSNVLFKCLLRNFIVSLEYSYFRRVIFAHIQGNDTDGAVDSFLYSAKQYQIVTGELALYCALIEKKDLENFQKVFSVVCDSLGQHKALQGLALAYILNGHAVETEKIIGQVRTALTAEDIRNMCQGLLFNNARKVHSLRLFLDCTRDLGALRCVIYEHLLLALSQEKDQQELVAVGRAMKSENLQPTNISLALLQQAFVS